MANASTAVARNRSGRAYPIIDAHTHPFGNRGLDLSPYIKTVRDPILLRRRQPELFKEMLKGTDDLTEEMLAAMDAAGIAKFKWPERLERIEALPLTPTQKVMRGRLRDLLK